MVCAWDSGERRAPQPDRAAGPDRAEKNREKRCFGRSENRDPVEHVLAIKFGDQLDPALPSGTILGRVLKEFMKGTFEGGQKWRREDSTANDSSPR